MTRAPMDDEAPKPPPWPARALVIAGSIAAVPVLGAVLAGTWAAVTARNAVRAVQGLPPARHRSRCMCRRCQREEVQ
jgi:hypothetical protein